MTREIWPKFVGHNMTKHKKVSHTLSPLE